MSGGANAGLVVDDVSLAIAGHEVLRGVSLAVRPGEVVGLVGRNGVGKTTLLRVASGVRTPDAGAVWLGDDAVATLSRRALAQHIAVVAQDTHVPFPFRVAELVLMGRAPHQPLFGFERAEDLAIARDAMERLGIAGLAERTVFELSGGERQLVMIARALTQRSELLLLDEPTAYLDLRHRIQVMRVVRRLAEEGRGALVVSHDLALAARACDRLVLLDAGRVAAAGPPAEVLTAAHLAQAFAIDCEVVEGPDGLPLLVPRVD